MMRAMTAFCAVATVCFFGVPARPAEAAARTKSATTVRAGAPGDGAAPSRTRTRRVPQDVAGATALPARARAGSSRAEKPRRDDRAASAHLVSAHDGVDAPSRTADKSASSGKTADATRKATAKDHATQDYDDGLVEFEEPSDVGVSARSKAVTRLQARDESSAHGKAKRGKGRIVYPVPKNASWRPYVREPWRRGYVSVSGHGKSWSGFIVDKNGDVLPAGRRGLSAALASWRTGREMLIDARLIALIADVSDEFGGRPIRIVSGYRETSYAPGSKHKVGQAFDFSVPGIPNEALRDFLRTLPDVGVGYYPNSTHVHLDVREKPCYWVDYSTPGAHPLYAWDRRIARMSPKERALAAELDALAMRREPLGRAATENVQRRAPLAVSKDEQPGKSPSRAAFAPVELANPSTMLVGSASGVARAEPATTRSAGAIR